MKKVLSILALILCLMLVISSCNEEITAPQGDADVTESDTQSVETADTSNDTSDTQQEETNPQPEEQQKIIKIYNAGQLLSLLELSKQGDYVSSKNTVYQLQTDIDLNVGWDATPEFDGDNLVAIPSVPATTWEGFSKFYGTFDGNGHTIKGVYMYANVDAPATIGFIDELCGGTVKNLTIDNSFTLVSAAYGTSDVFVGGLIGYASEGSVIENVTVNTNVCVDGDGAAVTSVTVAKRAEGITENALTANGGVYSAPEDPSMVKVYTAEQLLAAFAEHGDFKDKTLMIMADIDLNPGWSSIVTIGDTVVFPSTPATVWPEIATFKGTIEGNGHVISGIYKSMTAKGGSGSHGGMFNSFSGKINNLIISNSFIIATNSDWGSKNVRVGGIAGTVTAGASLKNVYMTESVEVWYKSHEGCMLGGAFGGADGAYYVDGFIYAGRVGHTNLSNATSFSLASGKNIWMGQLTGNQNWKDDTTIKNVAAIGQKFVGAVDSAQSGFIGTDMPTWKYQYCYTGKKDSTYSGYDTMVAAGWVWNDTLQCMIPGSLVELVNAFHAQ